MQMNFKFISSMEDALRFQNVLQNTRTVNERQSEDLNKEIGKMYDIRDTLTEQMKSAVLPKEKQDFKKRIEHCDKMVKDMHKRRDACMRVVTDCEATLSKLYCFVDI